jgi:hypothetical protein
MNHFGPGKWTDYIRGLVPVPEKELMDRHVADGCNDCVRMLGLVTRIQTDLAGQPVVPEHLVRAAKAVFPGEVAAEDRRANGADGTDDPSTS